MHGAKCSHSGRRQVGLFLVTMVLAGAVLAGCDTGPLVTGSVLCADGRAADGALVTLIAMDRVRMNASWEPHKIGQVRTDARGQFSARVAGRHEYVSFAARKAGWALGWGGWDPDRTNRPVKIRLKPAVVVNGRVVNEAGEPVRGAKVWADWRGASAVGIEGFNAVTGPQGQFTFHDVRPGAKLRFQVVAPGYARIDADGEQGDVIAPCDDVELKLAAEAPLEAEAVEKSTGKPVTDVELIAHVWQKTYNQPATPVPGRPGLYRWRNLPAGRGVVGVSTRLDRPAVWVAASTPMRTQAGQTSRVKLELTRGLPVEFVVKDAATGEPIAGATAGAYSRKAGVQCGGVSGPDGVVHAVALPGKYEMGWAYADRYAGGRRDAKLVVAAPTSQAVSGLIPRGWSPPGPPRVEILLERAPRIHGVVRLPDGGIAPDVAVTVLNDWAGETTGPDGRFEIWREYAELPGARRIMLLARDEQRDLAGTALVEDLAEPVDVRLKPGDVRQVHVTDAAGEPVARARVIAGVGWYNPDPPLAQWEAVTDAMGHAVLPVLPPDMPVAVRVVREGFTCAQQLLPADRPGGALEFRLHKPGPALPPAEARRVDIPPIPGGWAIWGATGIDDRRHVWFGVTSHDIDVPSAHLFEYDPPAGKLTDRGDVVGQLKKADLLRPGEQQMKIHSRICQAGEWMYFTSMDEKGEDERKGIQPTFGGHLWRISLKDHHWEHLQTAPKALIALGVGGGYVYALGYWGHQLYQYATADGSVRSVEVGAAAGHVSRNILVDGRGHVFVPRVTAAPEGLRAALVEFDTGLKELRSTPLPYYCEASPINTHGIIGLCPLPGGRIAFVTHNGFLSIIKPPEGEGPAEVAHLGFFHPDGPKYVASLFLDDGGRTLMGAAHKGFDQPYEWLAYDLTTGARRVGPVTAGTPAGLSLDRASLYGSICRDAAGACYLAGVTHTEDVDSKSVPILVKVAPPELGR